MSKYSKLGVIFTTRDLALKTGIPLDTIIKTIKANKAFNYIDDQSLVDNQVYSVKPNSLPKTSEEEYIRKEDNVLYRALLQFDKIDFEIYAHTYGLSGNETYGIPPYNIMDKKDIAEKYGKTSSQMTQIINHINKQLLENDELFNMYKEDLRHDKRIFSKRNSAFIPIEAGNEMMETANECIICIEETEEDY